MSIGSADSPWLKGGDTLEIAMSTGPGAVLDGSRTTPGFGSSSGSADDDTVVDVRTLQSVVLTIDEMLASYGTRRAWSAWDDEGVRYRVSEFDGQDDPDPDAAAVLPHLVDVPLAVTTRNQHLIRVFRHREGELMSERLERRTAPLSAAEVGTWMRPVFRAVRQIHREGYASLKLCPYSIKYLADDDVFLENVGGVYPLDREPGTLPAVVGYTAPEVYRGDFSEHPGVRADIFSLAMVTYYLVTRRDPPTSIYVNHMPALLARDFAPSFPLGFAPYLAFAGAALRDDRPSSIDDLEALLDEAIARVSAREDAHDDVALTVAAETHTGVVKRVYSAINQDAIFAASTDDHRLAVAAIADGVSTASFGSGDLASKMLERRIGEMWGRMANAPVPPEPDAFAGLLRDAVDAANRDVVDWVNERFAPFDGEPSEVMGSTCVVALARGNDVTLASVGDSRAYVVREGYMEQVTRDHNLLTLSIVGGVEPDVALTLPHCEALARCLGTFDIDGDGRLVAHPVQIDVYRFRLLPGDRLLLCTDGLTDFAGSGPGSAELAIYRVLLHESQPELACLDLVTLANHGGGGDNIGVAILAAERHPLLITDWYQRRAGAEEISDADIDAEPTSVWEAIDERRVDLEEQLDTAVTMETSSVPEQADRFGSVTDAHSTVDAEPPPSRRRADGDD